MSCPVSGADADGSAVCPASVAHSNTQQNGAKKATPTSGKLVPIPQPPPRWFTGNISELDPAFPMKGIWRLADVYGEIFKLDFVARKTVILSSYELINEVCDQDRFDKTVAGGLMEVRDLAGDGLFTSHTQEENWGKAHRILMPVFGPLKIKTMFEPMQDIITQMVQKWDRMGAEHVIMTSDDFTKLAFDTIAYCGFSHRFNSFYKDGPVEFAEQMGSFLLEAGKRATRTSIENSIRIYSDEERRKNRDAMWALCDKIVAERKAHPQPETNDILNAMLTISDSKTGTKLSDENIRFNLVTFLIAGHETTSGTLSFLFYHLLRNPRTYQKAQAEVDAVLGNDVMQLKHVPKLIYIEACLRETLRFQGPIATFGLRALKDTVIGGKYAIDSNMGIGVNLKGLHHDPKVWGSDAEVFKPERMMDGGFERLPPNAWKPFGNGARACIGRAFAEQEMIIAVAMILQKFDVTMADPSYDLHLKSTLTVKPDDFGLKVARRQGRSALTGVPGSSSASSDTKKPKTAVAGDASNSQAYSPLTILYGSNAGTCKYLAEDMASAAQEHGLNPIIKQMDEAADRLPTDQPVAIITPSYEGKPADNAKQFVARVEHPDSASDPFTGVKFGIFGVGNSEWTTTYHRIPQLLDEEMPKLGADRIVDAGLTDVKGDLTGDWEDWRDLFLQTVSKKGGKARSGSITELAVKVEKPSSAKVLAGDEISEGTVVKNEQLADASVGPPKRCTEIQLPPGMAYEAGDYLVVLPYNPREVIHRATRRFKLSLDDVISITGTNKAFLADAHPTTVLNILGTRVELSTPASKRQVEAIAKACTKPDEEKTLSALTIEDRYMSEILNKRVSVLDLLEDYPSADISFGAYLDMLKPLAPRQYSISSSPLGYDLQNNDSNGMIASVTYDVHEAPAKSGHGRNFQGVASNYLAASSVGSKIRCYVRRSQTGFHLPQETTMPIVMIAAGTGIAPFMGFIQQRAVIAKARQDAHDDTEADMKLGKAILYFGCRDYDKDFIYKSQLAEWQTVGAVDVRPAFSRRADPEVKQSWNYVYERMWDEREELTKLFKDQGAKIYVCGSAGKLAKSTMDVTMKIWRESHPEAGEEEARKWMQDVKDRVRYVSDVFD